MTDHLIERYVDGQSLIYNCRPPLYLDTNLSKTIIAVKDVVPISMEEYPAILEQRIGSILLQPECAPALSPFVQTESDLFSLVFDLTNGVTLESWLQKSQSVQEIQILLLDLAAILDTCSRYGILLKNVDFDSHAVAYFPDEQRFRFVVLPVQDLDPDVQKIRSFFWRIASKLNPVDKSATLLCNELSKQIRAISQNDFNPQQYQEILFNLAVSDMDEAIAQQPQIHAESTDTETTVLVDVFPISVQVEVKSVGGSSAVESEREWTHGKHLRQDPGTGVLNSIDLATINSEEDLIDLMGSIKKKEESVVHKTITQDIYADTSVASDILPSDSCANQIDHISTEPLTSETFSASENYVLVHQRTKQRVIVSGNHFVIGKSKNSSYQVLNTTTVSRSHAVFVCEVDHCWVIDDYSKNGTFVNDHRLEPRKRRALQQGDVIRMSDEIFVFEGSQQATAEVS